jgi:AcrR family transcriptional regulator
MPRVNTGARERIIIGAVDMLGRRGLSGTSLRELAEYAGAPLGSIYHYFPGGKPQLAAEAVRFDGDQVRQALARELQAGPLVGVRGFLARRRQAVIDSDFRAGCPSLAVAIEEPLDDAAAEAVSAAGAALSSWAATLAGSLRQYGVDDPQAGQLATLVIAALEGMVAMCRAQRDIQPFDDATAQLEALVAATVIRARKPVATAQPSVTPPKERPVQ